MMEPVYLGLFLSTIALYGAAWLFPPTRRSAWIITVIVPVVTLVWAAAPAGEAMVLDWFLLGSQIGVDEFGAPLLGLTSVLWLAAAVFSRGYLLESGRVQQYWFYFTLTMIGNLGLLVSLDVGSFLAFYTAMSVAAYGLIVHDRRESSLFAGRVYISLTVIGEMLLFASVALAVSQSTSLRFEDMQQGVAASQHKLLIAILAICGFGIKLGVMPLHFWLPLAHPAAPTPASAVLSGAMIKAGMVGIVRLLPLGEPGFEEIGPWLIGIGFASTFGAALIGAGQPNAKAVLAYSSISQMGLITILLGVAMLQPENWTLVLSVLVWFAIHHGIAKAALFLGVGVLTGGSMSSRVRLWAMGLLVISALAIAGLPLTTGFVAKAALKSAFGQTHWGSLFNLLLPATGVTTALVMARFVHLVGSHRAAVARRVPMGMVVPWLLLSAGAVVNWQLALPLGLVDKNWTKLTPAYLWNSLWPLGIASILIALIALVPRFRGALDRVRIPQGDLAVPVSIAAGVLAGLGLHTGNTLKRRADAANRACATGFTRLEDHLTRNVQVRLESETALLPLICIVGLLLFIALAM